MKTFRHGITWIVVAATSLGTVFGQTSVAYEFDTRRPLDVVARLNPAAGQLPEGLAVDADGTAYAANAPTGEIVKITPDGAVSAFVQLPDPSPGLLVGLEMGPSGDIFAAVASGNPATHGIWKISRSGTAELYAALDPSGFPNGIEFGDHALFVTDSFLGTVWKITDDGEVTNWKSDPLLVGNAALSPLGLPLGANGIAFTPDRRGLYVSNTTYGRIVRINLEKSGAAGEIDTLVDDVSLTGADGLALGPDGEIFVAINQQNKIARVSPYGQVEVICASDLLQFPASLVVRDHSLYITNMALLNAKGIQPGAPNPGVFRMSLSGCR